MHRILKALSFFVYPLVFCFVITQLHIPAYAQEQITISTYYPSPYGSYKDLEVAGDLTLRTNPSNPDRDAPQIQWRTGDLRHWNIDQFGDGSVSDPARLRISTEEDNNSNGVERVLFWDVNAVAGYAYNHTHNSPTATLEVLGSGFIKGDILAQGKDGFDYGGEKAKIYLGDGNHYISAEHGYGMSIFNNVPGSGPEEIMTFREVISNPKRRVGINKGLPRATLDVNGEIVATPRLTLAYDSGTSTRTWHMDNFLDASGAYIGRIFTQPDISSSGVEVLKLYPDGHIDQPSGGYHLKNGQLYMDDYLGSYVPFVNGVWATMIAEIGLVAAIVCLITGCASSIKYKKNIYKINNAVDKITKLNGVEFDWKSSDKHDIGMIAEDVAKVFPELITYEKDGKTIKGYRPEGLIGLLVEGIKEQQITIESQQKQIRELKEEFARIKKSIK